MRGFTIEIWFYGLEASAARDLAVEVIGSPFRWRRVPDPLPIGDRATLELLGEVVFFACGNRSGGHVVVSVTASSSEVGARHAFRSVFERVVASGHPAVAECVLAATTMDVYPWFTHTVHRSLPLTKVADHAERGSPQAVTSLGEEEFWRKTGPQHRFIATATLHRSSMLDPIGYARRVAATVVEAEGGWLFDCGWSTYESELFSTR